MTTKAKATKKATKKAPKRTPRKRAQAQPMTGEDADYIEKADALAMLGIGPRTLEGLASKGKLTRYTRAVSSGRGRRPVYFLRREVEALLKIEPVPSAPASNPDPDPAPSSQDLGGPEAGALCT